MKTLTLTEELERYRRMYKNATTKFFKELIKKKVKKIKEKYELKK